VWNEKKRGGLKHDKSHRDLQVLEGVLKKPLSGKSGSKERTSLPCGERGRSKDVVQGYAVTLFAKELRDRIFFLD